MLIQAGISTVASPSDCTDTWDWVEGSSASMRIVPREYSTIILAKPLSGVIEPVVKLVGEQDKPPTKLSNTQQMHGFSQVPGEWIVRDCRSVHF